MESVREVDGRISTDLRYYISDLDGRDAKAMLGYVRGHWGIENKLHWSLDVTFREDNLWQRVGHSSENLFRIRRLALHLLRQDKSVKVGAKANHFKSPWRTVTCYKSSAGRFRCDCPVLSRGIAGYR